MIYLFSLRAVIARYVEDFATQSDAFLTRELSRKWGAAGCCDVGIGSAWTSGEPCIAATGIPCEDVEEGHVYFIGNVTPGAREGPKGFSLRSMGAYIIEEAVGGGNNSKCKNCYIGRMKRYSSPG